MKKILFSFSAVLLVSACSLKTPPVSVSVIENQVRTIMEVPLAEYVYREILYIGEEARFLGIKHMDKRLLFSVNIVVRAGFDLSNGIHIQKRSNSVEIYLPEPEILETDVDEDSIHQFFVKEWGGKISRMDYYDELAKRKPEITSDAVKRGILERARENGEKTISRIMHSLGMETVTFVYSKPEKKDNG